VSAFAVGFKASVLGLRHPYWVQGVRVGCWIRGVGLEVSVCSKYPCWVHGFHVGFKGSVLGSRCPCRVQGIHVGFKVSALGSRLLSCVQGVRVGFKTFALGSRRLCCVRSVCVGFEAFGFVHTRRLLVCINVSSSLSGAWRWPDSGLLISTVWLSGVSGEIIHPLRT